MTVGIDVVGDGGAVGADLVVVGSVGEGDRCGDRRGAFRIEPAVSESVGLGDRWGSVHVEPCVGTVVAGGDCRVSGPE